MYTLGKRVLFGLLLGGWMFLIFSFSAQTGETSSALSSNVTNHFIKIIKPDYPSLSRTEQENYYNNVHLFVRKTAHFTEYAILAVFCFLFLSTFQNGKNYKIKLTILFCLIFACLDEWHQSFISERTPQVLDVLIDTSGTIIGVVICWYVSHLIKKDKTKK